MDKIWFIAKNNIKKKKSDVAVLFFVIGLASLLLYASSSVLSNMDQTFENIKQEMNGADYMYISTSPEKEQISSLYKGREEVEYVETEPCIIVNARYRGEEERQDYEMQFLFKSLEVERTLSTLLIEEEGTQKKENSIVLPYYCKSSGYRTGDTFFITVHKQEFAFEIYGFSQNILLATPMNISMFNCFISRESMEQIRRAEESLNYSTIYRMALKEGYSSAKFDEDIFPQLDKEVKGLSDLSNLSLSYEAMKNGTGIVTNIIMAIAVIFAVLILFIGMVIIWFSVKNFIESNLKNIGILKAAGYTGRQLVSGTMLEMMMITTGALLCGLLLGSACAGVIGDIVSSSAGIRWNVGFDLWSAGVTSLLITVLIAAITYFSTARYRTITVLDALREGIHTHNFKRNCICLESVKLPLHTALGIKSIWNQKAKSAAIAFIMAILAFTTCVGFFLYENFAVNKDKLMQLIGIETVTAVVENGGTEERGLMETGEELKGLEGIEEILYYTQAMVKIRFHEKEKGVSSDIWDDTGKLRTNTVAEGRRPMYDNEIMMTVPICTELGVTVGDVVYVEAFGSSKDYIVSGISQHINNLGMKAMLTLEGAKRLSGEIKPAEMYVRGIEGSSYQEISKRIQKVNPDLKLTDFKKVMEASQKSITQAMELICAAFILCTAVIVVMIVIMLVKIRLLREKKQIGIYKAIGFTTRQIIAQIVMSTIPVFTAGSIAGAAASVVIIDPFVVAALSFCGIRSCRLDCSFLWIIITVAGITVVAFTSVLLASGRIRRIEPCSMLREE